VYSEDEDLEDYEDSEADETETICCPNCQEEIYEEAAQCPYCGSYVLEEQFPSKPPWVILTAILLLVLMACYWILPLI